MKLKHIDQVISEYRAKARSARLRTVDEMVLNFIITTIVIILVAFASGAIKVVAGGA
jgi:hypothetical protein